MFFLNTANTPSQDARERELSLIKNMPVTNGQEVESKTSSLQTFILREEAIVEGLRQGNSLKRSALLDSANKALYWHVKEFNTQMQP